MTVRSNHVIYVNLTNACNLACPYCYVNQMVDGDITVADVAAQLPLVPRLSAAMGDHLGGYDVVYFGGEPLLRVDVLADVHVLLRRSLPVTSEVVLTNGLLMTTEVVERLRKLGVRWSLSFDGLSEPSEHRAPREALLREVDNVGVKCMISPATAGQVVANYRYMRTLVPANRLSMMPLRDDVWDEASVNTLAEQFRVITDLMIAGTDDEHVECLGTYVTALTEIVRRELIGDRRFGCYAGTSGFVLTSSRIIYPCARFAAAKRLPLADATTGEVFVDNLARMRVLGRRTQMPACEACRLRSVCDGACTYERARLGNFERSINIVGYCEVAKMIVDEALRYEGAVKHRRAFVKFLGKVTGAIHESTAVSINSV